MKSGFTRRESDVSLDDIFGLKAGSARVSNVVSIDGQDVMTFLKSESFFNLADPDSAWNYLFWNTARDPETIPLEKPREILH